MDEDYLNHAIELSKESVSLGGYPVGALCVIEDKVFTGVSNGKKENDATSHAEILAIRKTSQNLGRRDLLGATVYSSMEPCLMCFSACYWAGVTKIVYACRKTKVSHTYCEGLHDLEAINAKNNRQIKIVWVEQLEKEALSVIQSWQNSLKS